MARTIDTIFNEMVAQKNATPALNELTSSSATAIWRLMLYVVAFAVHVLEVLWDEYRKEVDTAIDEMVPHRPKWYRDKTLAFMADKTLIPDTDQYDTSAMGEDEIAAARVVKHATANESAEASALIIKVAGADPNDSTKRAPLTESQATQLAAYLHEIKDAGVRIQLVNEQPDEFRCAVDIYYDPTKEPTSVQYACEDAIRNYIENLPFNGQFSNMALIDALQAVDGVRIAELLSSESAPAASEAFMPINAYIIPAAGYFHLAEATINIYPYAL